MGSRIVPANGRAALVGFAVADDRLTVDELQATSTYTQAGPHPGSDVPGSATSQMQVVVSGEQSNVLTLTATQAGQPMLGGGARLAYRLDSESADDNRGWSPPQLLSGWTAAEYEAAATETFTLPSAVTIPSSQKVVVVYSLTNDDGLCRVYDPFTDTWSSRITILSESSVLNPRWAVCCLPDERLLAIKVANGKRNGEIYSSSDSGATWTLWADNPLPSADTNTDTKERVRLISVGDDLLYFQVHTNGTVNSLHFASNSLGTTWQTIEAWTGHTGVPDVAALPDGRIVVATIKNGSNRPEYRIAPSVWEPFSTITATEVSTQSIDEIAVTVDPTGVIWIIGRDNQSVYLWRSADVGATWEQTTFGAYYAGTSATGAAPIDFAPTWSAGALRVAHQWQATTGDEEASVGLMTCGGWSNVVAGPGAETVTYLLDAVRFGFGLATSAGVTSASNTWLPFDLPSVDGYTTTGAGTHTLDNGAVEISTTAQTRYYTTSAALGTTNERFVCLAQVKVTSGGAVGSNDVAIRLRLSDGTSGEDIVVRLKTDTIRFRDVIGDVNADVSVDCTEYVQILIYGGLGSRYSVFWRRPYATKWTLIGSRVCTSSATITTGLFEWGHIASSTSASSWRFLHRFQCDDLAFQGVSSDLIPSNIVPFLGFPVTALPFALGDKATAGATFLSAVAGPAYTDETHTVTPIYDYGVERLFWQVSPSLAEEWRSSGTAEATFDWAPSEISATTATGFDSRSIAVAFLGANFRTAYLEGFDGTSWTTLGTYDGATGFSTSLTATVTGDSVAPNTSTTADAGRYIQRGEFAGATAVVNSTYCYITWNEEGGWTQSATRRARLRVDRAVTSGAITIIARNGVLVVNNATTLYRRYRVRIPSQSTPDGYFRLAGLVVGGVVVPGLPWDWGWTEGREPNVEETVSRRGTTRRKQEGPPRRVLTFAWADGGVPLYRLRAGLNNDFLTPHSTLGEGAALATYKDVPWLMAGLQDQTRSGEVPVVALKSIPDTATSATLTDPTLWMYGRLDGTVQYAQVTGKTGDREYVRVETMSVREIV